MIRIKLFILIFLMAGTTTFGQSEPMPLTEWASSLQTPLIFYISGDGGINDFSTGFCSGINKKGFSISALNSRTYFWKKKTPEQTANDITGYLEKKFINRSNQQLILIGYSFGADVIPFIINNLPASIKAKLRTIFLLSPSTTTDFEIHWLELMGGKKKRDMDVVTAINALGNEHRVVFLNGSDEDDFPFKSISLKNYIHLELPGGHHFGNNLNVLVNNISKFF